LVPTPILVGVVILMLVLLLAATGELFLYAHDPRATWWQGIVIFVSEASVVSAWATVDLRTTDYLQPTPDRPSRWFRRYARRLPLLIAGFILLTYSLRYVLFALNGVEYMLPRSWPATLPVIGIYEGIKITMLYTCWLGLVFGIVSFVRIRQQAEHLLVAQRSLAEAKVNQLKGQLRPHFLFNAMNTVSATMQVDVARADRLLTRLGELLRTSLDTSERNLVPLSEELRLLEQYADIMQARFVDRVEVKWDIAERTLATPIPSMLLQPLLENAFKHGVERTTEKVTIHVRADAQDGNLHASIHNTGSGLPPLMREGWGLRSCRERLELLYGPAASLSLKEKDGGVEVALTLPSTPPAS
jgi:two-component sensor histidine kinase